MRAKGLTTKEIQTGSQGGNQILQFLKEHSRKTKEKAAMKKVIDKTEQGVQEHYEEIYGKPLEFME